MQKLHLIEKVLHLDSSEQADQLTNLLAELKRETSLETAENKGQGIPHEEVRALMLVAKCLRLVCKVESNEDVIIL